MKEKFELKVTGENSAYLKLPTYSDDLRSTRNITLVDAIGAYKGPFVVFDFDPNNVLVGIEIVVEDDEEDEEEEQIEGR